MPLNRPFARPCLSKISQRCIVRHPYRLRAFATEAKLSPSNSSRSRRIPWRYVFPAVFLAIGGAAGLSTRFWWSSRALAPIPFTEEDDAALDALADQIEELDIVKKMRAEGKQLHSDSSLGDANPGKGPWVELDIKENMTETSTDREKTARPFTRNVMGGIQGLGVQRAFWNPDTRELVAVVWIGPRLSGWPTVAHGGAIVAMFQDAMSRMIAGPHMSIDSIPTPASIGVTYAKPTFSFDMYVLRTSFADPDYSQQEAPPSEPAPAKSWLPSRKDLTKKTKPVGPEPVMEVQGTLESLDGEVKVRAKASWPADKVPFQLFDRRRLQISQGSNNGEDIQITSDNN